MKKTKQLIALLLGVAVLIIIFQNTTAVETKILWLTIIMPRAVLLTLTFALGVLTGILLTLRRRT